MSRGVFPFTALVGQEQMKLALVLNAVNPKIGGVLIRGEKGTAKSTAVRALAALLPEIEAAPGCPYVCPPDDCPHLASASAMDERQASARHVRIVELPVGATEDRVVGSLDVAQALSAGEVRFKPGLLAAANRGILYVDEVNLLNDHLVDVLLDAAAMGRNYVEREGISFEHAAQFILVGTMNPEEGDLRPQLLDRFALSVDVLGGLAPVDRAEVVRRRIAFEADPDRFTRSWQAAETAERRRIVKAQKLLPRVGLSDIMLDLITHICADFQVDGLRADIVMYKTALTLAAYAGRAVVNEEDVRQAAELALPHRRRRQPFESPESSRGDLERTIREHLDAPPPGSDDGEGGAPEDQVFEVGRRFQPRALAAPEARRLSQPRAGRRTKLQRHSAQGHYVSSRRPIGDPTDLAVDATLRAAALRTAQASVAAATEDEPAGFADDANFRAAALQTRQATARPMPAATATESEPPDFGDDRSLRASGGSQTGRAGQRRVRIGTDDVRVKVREAKIANLILFAVDASGSMAAMDRMAAAKGAILSLLLDAYQKRDQVGMISFRGKTGELLLPPTNSVDLAERQLRLLPTGGRTPLSHALQLGLATIERHRALHKDAVPLFVLISDGRPNVSLSGRDPLAEARDLASLFAHKQVHSVVVDTESGGLRLGLARELAASMGAHYLRLEELEAGRLAGAVRQALGRPN